LIVQNLIKIYIATDTGVLSNPFLYQSV